MSYYGESQWPAGAQPAAAWDHQTPPTRSGLSHTSHHTFSTRSHIDNVDLGASSTIPREETSAFWYQFEGTSQPDTILPSSSAGKVLGHTQDPNREDGS